MSTKTSFEDGKPRCSWLNSDPIYIDYHDTEWGVELVGDNAMFERVALEGFQAGLSWITILKRREGFREAFRNFELEAVAAMSPKDVEELMLNGQIIRNRAKIESTIRNARLALEIPEGLSSVVWNFAPPVSKRTTPAQGFEWRTTSPESDALSKALKKLGFGFVGTTTMHALMQATGMINDHAPECFRRSEISKIY